MRVIWHSRAIEGKKQVADYIRREFGLKRKKEFVQEVDKTARMLMSSPNIGSIDPLFADRSIAYRSIIINGLSKMVYRLDNEAIHIVAFWDTRREPNAQAAKVKE